MTGGPSRGARIAVRPRVAAGLIAAVAFFVWLLHVLSYDPWPTNDMSVYIEMAVKRLTFANLFRSEGICWFPPGYSLFMKPFFLLLEHDAALRAIQIAQAALGAWTCLLVYRLARRVHSTRAALVAALLACFYPHLIFYSSAWMSENLFIPIFLALLLVLLRAAQKPSSAALYRAGLLAGAAALVRPVAVSVAPVVLLAAFKLGARGRSGTGDPGFSRRAMLRGLALFAAGGLTLVGPWAVRNGIAYGHFVPIAPNGAFNLAAGNQPEATGTYSEPPSIIGDLWSRTEYFQEVSTGFVSNDPWGELFVIGGLKWRAFWEKIPPWPLYSSNPELLAGDLCFPMIGWRPIFSLGLVGVGVLFSRRRPGAWVTPACLGAYVAFYMGFFGGSRFRLPAECFFLAWAGIALAALVRIIPRLGRARAGSWAAAIGILLAVVLAQAGCAASEARRFLVSDGSLIASDDQIPIVPGKPAVTLFGGPLALDRSVGRYLSLSLTAFRQGPHRDTPDNGLVQITYLDRKGDPLQWLDNPRYFLEAVPEGRWVTLRFKSRIPPAAAGCRITIAPQRSSPDTLILDQPILRYARGNDPAMEFLFPYLRYED